MRIMYEQAPNMMNQYMHMQTSNMLLSIYKEQIDLSKIFSRLCTLLTDSIMQKKIIQELDLLNFSRISFLVFRNNISKNLDAFEKLSGLVYDYWRYELDEETNFKRSCSYIRLYQMIIMIHTFYMDYELECKVHNAMDDNRKNANVIKHIREHPGITYRELQKEMKSDELQNLLKLLEKQNFLIGRRDGEERYYLLTNYGDILYRNLFLSKYNYWLDQWSSERIFVHYFALMQFKKYNEKDIAVQDVVKKVSALSENQVIKLYKCLNKFLKTFVERNSIINEMTDIMDFGEYFKYIPIQEVLIQKDYISRIFETQSKENNIHKELAR